MTYPAYFPPTDLMSEGSQRWPLTVLLCLKSCNAPVLCHLPGHLPRGEAAGEQKHSGLDAATDWGAVSSSHPLQQLEFLYLLPFENDLFVGKCCFIFASTLHFSFVRFLNTD